MNGYVSQHFYLRSGEVTRGKVSRFLSSVYPLAGFCHPPLETPLIGVGFLQGLNNQVFYR